SLAAVAVIAFSLGVGNPQASDNPVRESCGDPASSLSADHGATLAYQKDKLKLARARHQAAIEGAAAALAILDDLAKDTAYQDILTQAQQLRSELAQKAIEERDAKNGWRSHLANAVDSPWIVQLAAVLLTVVGAWFGLKWMRDGWRWVESRLGWHHRPWQFAGVRGDDALGARDPILDAIRRVPHEVRQPVWTPTRLLMYPGPSGWEVWEDFGVGDSERPKPVHEELFQMDQWDQGSDKALADAFQNLQFNFGAVGLGTVMKFWSGLVDWWQAGQPSLCATCLEID